MEPYERLIAQMPEIAEAVNAFTSEQVQQQAFHALIKALGGPSASVRDEEEEPVAEPEDEEAGSSPSAPKRSRRVSGKNGATASGAGRERRRKLAAPKVSADLNLRPADKRSFADFAEEKKPATTADKNVVAVYYLLRVIGRDKVSVDDVYSCYKDRAWRVPNNLYNNLQVTASLHRWINTAKSDDIQLNVPGENHVEHDLPPKPKA